MRDPDIRKGMYDEPDKLELSIKINANVLAAFEIEIVEAFNRDCDCPLRHSIDGIVELLMRDCIKTKRMKDAINRDI